MVYYNRIVYKGVTSQQYTTLVTIPWQNNGIATHLQGLIANMIVDVHQSGHGILKQINIS